MMKKVLIWKVLWKVTCNNLTLQLIQCLTKDTHTVRAQFKTQKASKVILLLQVFKQEISIKINLT